MTETLEALASAFRAHRGGRARLDHGKGYPVDLRRRAVSMLPHYDGKVVAARLGLSSVTVLERWVRGRSKRREERRPSVAAPGSSRAFIELRPDAARSTAVPFCVPSTPLEVEMIGASGVRLLVRGAVSERIVQALAQQVLAVAVIRGAGATADSSRA